VHLSKSLLRLGFTKTKHDPALWMAERSSHYEYWLRMLMKFFSYLEQGSHGSHKVIGKGQCVKERRHSRILFMCKCKIPWRSMEESGISISSIIKDIHSKRHPEI
jgi:hypothetical protein